GAVQVHREDAVLAVCGPGDLVVCAVGVDVELDTVTDGAERNALSSQIENDGIDMPVPDQRREAGPAAGQRDIFEVDKDVVGVVLVVAHLLVNVGVVDASDRGRESYRCAGIPQIVVTQIVDDGSNVLSRVQRQRAAEGAAVVKSDDTVRDSMRTYLVSADR